MLAVIMEGAGEDSLYGEDVAFNADIPQAPYARSSNSEQVGFNYHITYDSFRERR